MLFDTGSREEIINLDVIDDDTVEGETEVFQVQLEVVAPLSGVVLLQANASIFIEDINSECGLYGEVAQKLIILQCMTFSVSHIACIQWVFALPPTPSHPPRCDGVPGAHQCRCAGGWGKCHVDCREEWRDARSHYHSHHHC